MSKFNSQQIEDALLLKAKELGSADFQRIASAGQAVKQLIREFPKELSKTKDQAWLLFEIVKSHADKKNLTDQGAQLAASALIYIGSPMDLVPDDESDGFHDDAAVVALAIARAEADVRKFCELDRRDPAKYL